MGPFKRFKMTIDEVFNSMKVKIRLSKEVSERILSLCKNEHLEEFFKEIIILGLREKIRGMRKKRRH